MCIKPLKTTYLLSQRVMFTLTKIGVDLALVCVVSLRLGVQTSCRLHAVVRLLSTMSS
jgi:hypothetical protein